MAEHPHGIRARYRAGCRCEPCRAANALYSSHPREARRRGVVGPPPFVSAARTRAHLLGLRAAGVGVKAVADASDVSLRIVWAIRLGKQQRVRRSTQARLLAVTPDAVADGASIPAAPTLARIEHLVREEGFTYAEIARRMGYRRHQLQFLYNGASRTKARLAARVERFFRLQTKVPA